MTAMFQQLVQTMNHQSVQIAINTQNEMAINANNKIAISTHDKMVISTDDKTRDRNRTCTNINVLLHQLGYTGCPSYILQNTKIFKLIFR